jgi:Zn-dependent peptidase ImmA (M78 family)/transcriptional regulator with XRE-family HTH domain
MGIARLKVVGSGDVRESLATKLKTARSLTGMSTRRVAEKLAKRFPISHATVANYESGRTVPPLDVLAALAYLYDRPLNWFLERGKELTRLRYRNLKSRVKATDIHRYEAEVQRWIDAYVALEERLDRPLVATVRRFKPKATVTPAALGLQIRRHLGFSEDEPIPSVVDVLERFGIRVLESPTDLRIDGIAARYGSEDVIVLNPVVPNDRCRLNVAHELAHILYDDCQMPEESKAAEDRAYEFAGHFLLPNAQLKQAFVGKSMVRLVQFKERFGISLAAMVYRGEKHGFITKAEAKHLWVEFARRGWRTIEPGQVRPDRATRFEQLIDEALLGARLSLKEAADLCGVRPEAIRRRVNYAMGISEVEDASQEGGMTMLPFPQ